jgi:hypothetical protein
LKIEGNNDRSEWKIVSVNFTLQTSNFFERSKIDAGRLNLGRGRFVCIACGRETRIETDIFDAEWQPKIEGDDDR